MSQSKRREVSWEEVMTTCHRLAALESKLAYDAILTVARGGLVPAAIVAQRLDQRHILSAALASYSDGERGEQLHFLEFPTDAVLAGRRILVIDDIWDSGRTAVTVRRRLVEAGALPRIAVLHYKPGSSKYPDQAPDRWMEETSDWIVYPWEDRA